MKKLRFLSLLAVLLAFTLFFTACGDGAGGGDNWSQVTNMAQLNGVWQGSYNQTLPLRQWWEAWGGYWDPSMQIVFGNMNLNIRMEFINLTINSNTGRMTGTQRVTETYSGGNIRDVWPILRSEALAMGATVNDSNYSTTMTDTVNEYIPQGQVLRMQINQSGNRVRMPAMDFGFITNDYFIMEKR